jgi:nanoRNase/pAp phosphatase (c-di-AMP/oligoRNAs hydrolase)
MPQAAQEPDAAQQEDTQREGWKAAPERSALILVTDRPRLFERAWLPGRRLFRWRAPDRGAAGPGVGELFRGDPTDPATYRDVAAGPAPLAVIALRECGRALQVATALKATFPEPAALLLCEGEAALPDDTVGTCLPWSELVHADLEGELDLLEAKRHVRRLLRFAEGARVLPILIHPDPDPDAIASAFAVRTLLRRKASAAPIVCTGEITRPENRRMAELLRIQVTQISEAELERFERVITVDTQPLRLLGRDGQRVAVIDHHPLTTGADAELADVRPGYGATATILTEYLRAEDERRLRRPLATALLYGIKTDTASLSRGVSPQDVRAYAFLQERADAGMLRRVERPAYPEQLARAFGRAIAGMAVAGDTVAAFVGELDDEESHILPDVADFCLALEGIAWVAAGGWVDDRLIVNLRHLGAEPGAGALAKALAANGGSGGGHPSMARAALPRTRLDAADEAGLAAALLVQVREAIEGLAAGGEG